MLSRLGVLAATAALILAVVPAASAATLKAPVPRAPAAGAAVETVPSFTWRSVRRAAEYEFQVAADKGFGSIVDKGSFRTRNTAATLKTSLANGTYFWRVRGITASDKAGRWSPARSFEKAWVRTPELLEPSDALAMTWPSRPLVLRWTAVPHATKYHVTIASDPGLAHPVIGSATRPVETQGTVYALPGALAQGTYYWAVTPVDEGGFKGHRSRVGSFSWGWSTGSAGRVLDLDPAAEVFDPLLQWDPVPGASAYEVEVNPTAEFTPGSKAFGGVANGTSIAPTVHLLNNTYHWRVRAIDPDGNPGVWNEGPVFKKEFDDVTPTVRDIRMLDHAGVQLAAGSTTPEPFFTWSPVPGASRYELQFAPYAGYCDWSAHFGDNPPPPASRPSSTFTEGHAWAVGWGRPSGSPGSATWPQTGYHYDRFTAGRTYCMRVLALDGADNVSEWTYVNAGQPTDPHLPAFTYQPDIKTGSCATPMPQAAYREPAEGTVTPRTPYFTWDPVPGAASYYVVVAKDAEFTEVVDIHFTRVSIYAPFKQYPDETTSYYWKVIPAAQGNGLGWCSPHEGMRTFQKRSSPPELIGPADGGDVPVQPLFRWTSAESAATYQLQIASDPGFKQLLDDVKTAATAYASTKAYPADTQLYWRVRANTRSVSLNWSQTRSFRRRLPVPEIAESPGGGETIPVLGWHPVQGAVSYDLHVDQADGTQRDFNMRSTRFTPTLFYGTGIWRWKVRANFPGRVQGGYSASREYVRRLNAPQAVKVGLGRRLMLFTWNPDVAAKEYRFQISTSDSFGPGSVVETVTTPVTSYAPLLTQRGYTDGGKLWWRLAVVDEGRNVGAYTTGLVALPRAMTVRVQGSLTPRRPGTLLVTVRDAKGRALRKAQVRASGAGARGRKRTSKNGVARMRVRASRRGTVTIRVKRRGFNDGVARVRVGNRGVR